MPVTPAHLKPQYELTAKDLADATSAHVRTVRKWEAPMERWPSKSDSRQD
jgi:hypothetical protein